MENNAISNRKFIVCLAGFLGPSIGLSLTLFNLEIPAGVSIALFIFIVLLTSYSVVSLVSISNSKCKKARILVTTAVLSFLAFGFVFYLFLEKPKERKKTEAFDRVSIVYSGNETPQEIAEAIIQYGLKPKILVEYISISDEVKKRIAPAIRQILKSDVMCFQYLDLIPVKKITKEDHEDFRKWNELIYHHFRDDYCSCSNENIRKVLFNQPLVRSAVDFASNYEKTGEEVKIEHLGKRITIVYPEQFNELPVAYFNFIKDDNSIRLSWLELKDFMLQFSWDVRIGDAREQNKEMAEFHTAFQRERGYIATIVDEKNDKLVILSSSDNGNRFYGFHNRRPSVQYGEYRGWRSGQKAYRKVAVSEIPYWIFEHNIKNRLRDPLSLPPQSSTSLSFLQIPHIQEASPAGKDVRKAKKAFKDGLRAIDGENSDEAIELFLKGLNHNPANHEMRYHLAKVLTQKGDVDLAMDVLQQIKALACEQCSELIERAKKDKIFLSLRTIQRFQRIVSQRVFLGD